MAKQYSARYDVIFQQSICTEENLDILKWFLEHLLKKEIKSLKVLTPILPINNRHERNKTVDILLETETERINVEVNNIYYKSLFIRNFAYLGASYNAAAPKNKDYTLMPAFIQINLSWNLPAIYKDDPLLVFQVKEDIHNSCFVENLKILVYNMDYYKRMYYNKNEVTDKYLLMLDLTGNELKKICKGDAIMEKFQKNVDRLNADADVVHFLSAEEEEEILKNTFKSEGFNEGFNDGFNDGFCDGKAEGQKESKFEIAQKLLKKEMPFNDVLEVTGLSKEELKKLQMNL